MAACRDTCCYPFGWFLPFRVRIPRPGPVSPAFSGRTGASSSNQTPVSRQSLRCRTSRSALDRNGAGRPKPDHRRRRCSFLLPPSINSQPHSLALCFATLNTTPRRDAVDPPAPPPARGPWAVRGARPTRQRFPPGSQPYCELPYGFCRSSSGGAIRKSRTSALSTRVICSDESSSCSAVSQLSLRVSLVTPC